MKPGRIEHALVAGALALSGTAALAQDYPNKPLRMIVGYAPGGIVDFVARTVGQRLAAVVNQPVVADNRPGAGGTIATQAVIGAAPDGYTILAMDAAIVINPNLQAKAPYEFGRDLQIVTYLGAGPMMVAAHPSVPAKNIAELIEYARAHPGKLNFASAGAGTAAHLTGELFKLRAQVDMTHVPYKGAGPAMADLVAGQIQLAFASITAALPHQREGRLRGLATTGERRPAAVPDLPTVIEAGLRGFAAELWVALFVPAAVPAPIVAQLNAQVRKAMLHPSMKADLAKFAVEARDASVEENMALIRREAETWAGVIRDAKLKGVN
jgi:tripartite-type tricarboxylate transporter receptor subunit TctC